MRQDLTDLTMVIDRSGSMHRGLKQAQEGLDEFFNKQKQAKGECNISLLEFDDEFNYVYDAVNIKDTTGYTLEPRGMTALNDAIAMAINKTGQRLAELPEEERPGLVMFCVVTDGGENASKEFPGYDRGNERLKEMIDLQTNTYNWKFTFIGANQNAVTEGGARGFAKSSSLSVSKNSNLAHAYNSMSSGVECLRNQTFERGPVEIYEQIDYSDSDRKKATK